VNKARHVQGPALLFKPFPDAVGPGAGGRGLGAGGRVGAGGGGAGSGGWWGVVRWGGAGVVGVSGCSRVLVGVGGGECAHRGP
jgi:hypothetical protein